jgi:shikimate dehydrogenase
MHAAAFRALGLDHTYDTVRVEESELGTWVERLRRGEVGGINVTIPHKRAAMLLADEVDDTARRCEACNVLALRSGRVVAFNTDVGALARELMVERPPGPAIVLGNGGAARAAVAALTDLGAPKITIRARRGGDEPLEPTGTEHGARWIVQATSAGMTGKDDGRDVARAVRFDLAPNALALDVIYDPPETPFLAAARAAGLPTKNGLGMLVRQGALALEIWLGVTAPLDVMRGAAQ